MSFLPQPTYGSAMPDGVRVGSVRGGVTNINTAAPGSPAVWVEAPYPTFDNGAPGVPLGIDYPYIAIPPAADAQALKTAAAITGAGLLLLAAGTGVVIDTTTFPGYRAYNLGVARTLEFVGNATTTAVTFTISGWDYWGARVVENVTLGTGSLTVVSKKAFRWINSINASAASGGTVSIGTTDTFGLPYYVPDATYMLPMWSGVPDYAWDNTLSIMKLAGAFVAGVTTFPATATTGDVRGTYQVDATVASDGTKAFAIRILMPLVDPIYTRGTSPQTKAAYGVPQFATGWM